MVEISDNLKAIYIDEGLEEPKLTKSETSSEDGMVDCSFGDYFYCGYCGELSRKPPEDFKEITAHGKDFCCYGCREKYIEKGKDKEIDNSNKEIKEALGEENERLRKENKDLINERNYYETYSIDFEQRIEQLKRENKMLETLSCNRSDEIVSLKREIHNEKIKSEAYKNNAEVILPDAEKIKNEARAELAEAKLKLTDLEKIVKEVRKFVDGALKLEVPGSPVYCLLRGMKEVLEVEKDENL